ncbi:SPOR domain-containing protein [bacterium]|nr:SPOR domain-containing protein [bacterium]
MKTSDSISITWLQVLMTGLLTVAAATVVFFIGLETGEKRALTRVLSESERFAVKLPLNEVAVERNQEHTQLAKTIAEEYQAATSNLDAPAQVAGAQTISNASTLPAQTIQVASHQQEATLAPSKPVQLSSVSSIEAAQVVPEMKAASTEPVETVVAEQHQAEAVDLKQARAMVAAEPSPQESALVNQAASSTTQGTIKTSEVKSKGTYSIQVSSDPAKSSAEVTVRRLKKIGYTASMVPTRSNGKTYYKITVPGFLTSQEAEKARKKIAGAQVTRNIPYVRKVS